MMKTWLVGVLAVAMTVTLLPDADAKRLGGARSSGMQRDMPARTAPDAPPARPATPAQGTPNQGVQPGQAAAPVAGAAAAGAAASTRSRWMGPIAGLAAGLGIAALASALGFGEAFANFLMIALLAMLAVVVIGFIVRRMAAKKVPAYAAPGANRAANPGAQVAWPARNEPTAGGSAAAGTSAGASTLAADPVMARDEPVAQPEAVADAAPARAVPKAFVPASFDSPAFERVAKMIFIRLQAANDTGDLNDLRSFTTPEMFAELKMDLQDRGSATQHTDVVRIESQVIDVAEEGAQQIVSVRFTGQVREESNGPLVDFDEVWHLVKPLDDSRSWAIAGIEQMAH